MRFFRTCVDQEVDSLVDSPSCQWRMRMKPRCQRRSRPAISGWARDLHSHIEFSWTPRTSFFLLSLPSTTSHLLSIFFVFSSTYLLPICHSRFEFLSKFSWYLVPLILASPVDHVIVFFISLSPPKTTNLLSTVNVLCHLSAVGRSAAVIRGRSVILHGIDHPYTVVWLLRIFPFN